MKVITLTLNSTNCYLVSSNNGWVMIDTGWPDTFSQLLPLLKQNDISLNEINYLIITHFHPDHAGLTQNLRDLGTQLIIHECQSNYFSKLNSFFKKNPKANFKDIMKGNILTVDSLGSRNFLEEIGIKGEIAPTPGHSDDSVSLIIDDFCAFTGDLPEISLSEAYGSTLCDDSWNLLKSLHLKTIYPGHGEPYSIEDYQ